MSAEVSRPPLFDSFETLGGFSTDDEPSTVAILKELNNLLQYPSFPILASHEIFKKENKKFLSLES